MSDDSFQVSYRYRRSNPYPVFGENPIGCIWNKKRFMKKCRNFEGYPDVSALIIHQKNKEKYIIYKGLIPIKQLYGEFLFFYFGDEKLLKMNKNDFLTASSKISKDVFVEMKKILDKHSINENIPCCIFDKNEKNETVVNLCTLNFCG